MGGGGRWQVLFMVFDKKSTEVKMMQHFLLIGGFLGAGKTTLIQKLTETLEARGQKIGLITNDQGRGLMDTDSARFATQGTQNIAEITGGCFCCRLEELVESIAVLEKEARPDVLIAEPVGSCTDLMATVLQPLETVYETPMTLAPLAVVLDARRILSTLGGKKNKRSFHRDVGYVFQKQIEEAECLVINKTDLLGTDDLEDLKIRLSETHPEKDHLFISAKHGEGITELIDYLLNRPSSPAELMEVDYERYAIGEALLGWVNLEGTVRLLEGNQPEAWLGNLAQTISIRLEDGGHEVGHFKMSLQSECGKTRWRTHQVLAGEAVELLQDGPAPSSGEGVYRFLVNLRAEGDAEILQTYVHEALDSQSEAKVSLEQEAAFQPGKPEPTHRVTDRPAGQSPVTSN